jgi:hypothetical protein
LPLWWIEENIKLNQHFYNLCLGKEVSEEEWENVYSSTFYLLNDTQLQSFQLKINHRIIKGPYLTSNSRIVDDMMLN